MDYPSKSPPQKKRSVSPKTSPPKELVAFLLQPEHRNFFEMVQTEYLAPEDRLTLREVAKKVSVVGDHESDKLRGGKTRMIKQLKKLLDDYDQMTMNWEANQEKAMSKRGLESMKILEENMKIIKEQQEVEDNIRETVAKLNRLISVSNAVLSSEERKILNQANMHSF